MAKGSRKSAADAWAEIKESILSQSAFTERLREMFEEEGIPRIALKRLGLKGMAQLVGIPYEECRPGLELERIKQTVAVYLAKRAIDKASAEPVGQDVGTGKWAHVRAIMREFGALDCGRGCDKDIAAEHNRACGGLKGKPETCERINALKVAEVRAEWKKKCKQRKQNRKTR